MAERRMFAKTIIDSDAFLDMPLSTQALYFHLSMRADDDGFVNNPKKIQRMVGASDDDCRILIMKRFILTFESGVIVIKHWKIHNYIRNDRYKETVYLKEKSTLALNNNNAYTEKSNLGIPMGDKMETQDSIGKVRIELDKENKENIERNSEAVEIFNYWNDQKIIQHRELNNTIEKAILKSIKKYGKENVKEYIRRYSEVVNDKEYYFDYKWSLKDFLNRQGGISDFLDDGSKWVNYQNRNKSQSTHICNKNNVESRKNKEYEDYMNQLSQIKPD